MIVLGIDPGKSGALCIIAARPRQYRVIDCIDVPTDDDGVEPNAVINFIQNNPPDFALIERVSAMPSQPDPNDPLQRRRGMGATSAFNFGGAYHSLRVCVIGLGIRLHKVEVKAWKKVHGLSSKDENGRKLATDEVKEASRQRAIKLLPDQAQFFARKRDHNRGEAALIAIAGAIIYGDK